MQTNLDQLRIKPSNDEINALPLHFYEGEVHIVRSMRQWQEALPILRDEPILGFDTETRPTFKKGKLNPPALIQLATANSVFLVQLGWLPFGQHCSDLLSDQGIIKVGVSIGDDMNALAKVFDFRPGGIIDLGDMADKNGLASHGLRTLAASLFGWRISKSMQCSNWNARDLSPKQITYAATDAWISRLIYMRLLELGLDPEGPAQ